MPAHYTECAADLVSSCSQTHWSPSVSHCPLYTLPVVADGRTYRNPHCAECNGHHINQTQCSPGLTQSPTVWRASMFHRLLIPTVSYFLDFSRHPNCDSDQFYEPLYRRCYTIQCSESRPVNIAGYCVRCSIELILKKKISHSISEETKLTSIWPILV